MSITNSFNIFEQSADKVLADGLDGGRSGESGRGSWRIIECIFKSYQKSSSAAEFASSFVWPIAFAHACVSLDVSEQWSFNGALSVK
jgi:hypothetical protein